MSKSITVSVLADASETLEALQNLVGWADELQLAYAWASSAGGTAPHWQALDLDKIRRAIVGIQWAHTEPYVLHQLIRRPGVLKVVDDTGGVFHPKISLGLKGQQARAILGSSNLTGGGFSGNTELNVLIRGSRTEAPLARVIEFIDAQWNSVRAFHPDQDWLTQYSLAHGRRPKPPRVPPRRDAKRTVVQSVRELDVTWNEFYALIAQQERRTLASGEEIHVFDHPNGSYLQEADRCREAFERYPSFATMPEKERKLVAGWAGGTSGYFGGMGGAGYFKQLVRTSPEVIAERLDKIPLVGEVSPAAVEAYLNSMFKIQGVHLGTATRLLTAKRPDLFLTLTSTNRKRIRQVFEKAPTTVSGYLRLHERIWSLPWFRAPQPDGVDERRVWHARVALLDTILYEREK